MRVRLKTNPYDVRSVWQTRKEGWNLGAWLRKDGIRDSVLALWPLGSRSSELSDWSECEMHYTGPDRTKIVTFEATETETDTPEENEELNVSKKKPTYRKESDDKSFDDMSLDSGYRQRSESEKEMSLDSDVEQRRKHTLIQNSFGIDKYSFAIQNNHPVGMIDRDVIKPTKKVLQSMRTPGK